MSFGIPVRNGLGLGLLASTSLATGNVGSVPFTPASLFASGAPGFLLDATLADLSSLFQDSAGTIPVTAVEQPVGRVLDTSGRGNHFVQSTAAARPVLSARVNLLTKTEQFDDAVWLKTNITVSANTTDTTDPLGGNTADRALETITNAAHFIDVSGAGLAVTNGVTYTRSVCLKFLGRQWVVLDMFDTVSRYTYFDIQNGVVGTNAAGTTASIQNLGNGWFRCSITRTVAASTLYIGTAIATSDGGSLTFVGDITKGYYIWGADLRVANDTALPIYQRVNTATDYDTTGFPLYLRYDGVDDRLSTSGLSMLKNVNGAFICAGVRYLGTASGYITIFEADIGTSASDRTGLYIKSTSAIEAGGRRLDADAYQGLEVTSIPTLTNVLSGVFDYQNAQLYARVNGVQTQRGGGFQTAGNTSNTDSQAITIGAAGASAYLNGRIYFPLVVLGRTATATEIANMESFINTRNGIY